MGFYVGDERRSACVLHFTCVLYCAGRGLSEQRTQQVYSLIGIYCSITTASKEHAGELVDGEDRFPCPGNLMESRGSTRRDNSLIRDKPLCACVASLAADSGRCCPCPMATCYRIPRAPARSLALRLSFSKEKKFPIWSSEFPWRVEQCREARPQNVRTYMRVWGHRSYLLIVWLKCAHQVVPWTIVCRVLPGHCIV